MTRPAVSQHLTVLLAAELVTFERVGTRNLYRLRPAGFGVLREWLDDMWTVALASYAVRAEPNAAHPGG